MYRPYWRWRGWLRGHVLSRSKGADAAARWAIFHEKIHTGKKALFSPSCPYCGSAAGRPGLATKFLDRGSRKERT